MTATNMCSNFGSKWSRPTLVESVKSSVDSLVYEHMADKYFIT